jgi:hypothetical protein
MKVSFLKVLGDTYSSHNISDDDVLIVGRMGLLVAGCKGFVVLHSTVMCNVFLGIRSRLPKI